MGKSNVVDIASPDTSLDPLTKLLKSGARQLIPQAVEAELKELLSSVSERRLPDGRAEIVRNGSLPERDIQTGIGPGDRKSLEGSC